MKYSNIQKAVSLVLKAVVFVCAVVGTAMSASAGRNSFMGGTGVFMYFTIQSNLFIAIIAAAGAVRMLKGRASSSWYIFKFVGTIAISLTCGVFCFVLAPTMGAHAWNIQNILTHVVVPAAAVIDFFVAGTGYDISYDKAFYVIIPPIMYAVYAAIGYVRNWQFAPGVNYPYFFLNWGSPLGAFGFGREIPFMGCAWWILALLVLLLVFGWLYLALLKLIRNLLGQ